MEQIALRLEGIAKHAPELLGNLADEIGKCSSLDDVKELFEWVYKERGLTVRAWEGERMSERLRRET